jgi:hypothetical protein
MRPRRLLMRPRRLLVRLGLRGAERTVVALMLLLLWSCGPPPEPTFTLRLDPLGRTPLAAEAVLESREPVIITRVEIEGGVSSDLSQGLASTTHRFPILGFVSGSSHQVRLHYRRASSETVETTWPVEVVTKPLPADFPIIDVKRGDPKLPAEGGYLLVSLSPLERAEPLDQKGLVVLLDTEGRVIWYMATRSAVGPMRVSQQGGHLLLQQFKSLRQDEISWTGEVLRTWQASGLRAVEDASMAVPVDTLHHDFQEMGNGQFWTLSSRLREQGKLRRVDELLLHIDGQGAILEEISLMDLLDPGREVHPRYPNYWEMFYGRGVIDWGHANSLVVSGSTALLSLAYQDAVLKLDLKARKPLWILGRPDGWRAPWSELLLNPLPPLRWPAKQHSATYTRDGNILLFDNGTSQSRVVEYRVDEQARTVEQVWEFADGPGFFSPLLSGVRELPQTGNIEIADGTRSANWAGYWCRVLEVTHSTPPVKVLEVSFRRRQGAGVSLYRCERLPSLYPVLKP